MRHVLALAALLLPLLAASGGASAVDLRNESLEPVTVQVRSATMTKAVALAPRSLAIVVCVGSCRFEVPGMGRVVAGGSDVVAIRGGALTRRAATVVSAR